jgi:hypothetical protein
VASKRSDRQSDDISLRYSPRDTSPQHFALAMTEIMVTVPSAAHAVSSNGVRHHQPKYLLKELDVRESVHRDTIMKATNKMQLYRLVYYS